MRGDFDRLSGKWYWKKVASCNCGGMSDAASTCPSYGGNGYDGMDPSYGMGGEDMPQQVQDLLDDGYTMEEIRDMIMDSSEEDMDDDDDSYEKEENNKGRKK